jgi:hypothetical protein
MHNLKYFKPIYNLNLNIFNLINHFNIHLAL